MKWSKVRFGTQRYIFCYTDRFGSSLTYEFYLPTTSTRVVVKYLVMD